MAEGRREYESTNIPTVLSETTNRNHDFYVFLTQRYNLGFKRDIPQAENDTTPAKQEFVPVTSFIHTIQVERARHSFNSNDDMREKLLSEYLLLIRIILMSETVLLTSESRTQSASRYWRVSTNMQKPD